MQYPYPVASPTFPERPLKVFYCYARKDERLRDELDKHLEALKRSGQISIWYDRKIKAGMNWQEEIDWHLDTADIVLLLVTPNFMASNYCYGGEMQRAFERYEQGKAYIIPIILRPTHWEKTPFSKLQVLPTDGKPVVMWPNRDKAFLDVVKGIQRVVNTLRELWRNNADEATPRMLESDELSKIAWFASNGFSPPQDFSSNDDKQKITMHDDDKAARGMKEFEPVEQGPIAQDDEQEITLYDDGEIEIIDFVGNSQPRFPVLLIVDTTEAMSEASIKALEEGLRIFQTETRYNELLSERVEIGIVSFGDGIVKLAQSLRPVRYFHPPNVKANGIGSMGAAIHVALDMIEARKVTYREHAVPYYRPWIFLITNSEPNDEWQTAKERIRKIEQNKGLRFFIVGLEDTKMPVLSRIAVLQAAQLQGLKFIEMFRWIADAQNRFMISNSTPGGMIDLPPLDDWVKFGSNEIWKSWAEGNE